MEEATKSTQQKGLLHKFAPFRKRQLRNAQSEQDLSNFTSGSDKDPSSPPPAPPQVNFSDTSLGQSNAKEGHVSESWFPQQNNQESRQPMADPATPAKKLLPPYTIWPMPVPERGSSTNSKSNRETVVYQKAMKDAQESRSNGRSKTPNADTDAMDEIASGFDDDLLRPRSPVSPVIEEAPKSNGRRSAAKQRRHSGTELQRKPRKQAQPPPMPVGPPTPVDSTANGSLHDSSSYARASTEPEVYSAPDSVVSRNLGLPATLGPDALAQLQVPSADKSDVLETELNLGDDPDSWDVINPNQRTEDQWNSQLYSLEKRAEQLYSADHLHLILEDPDFHSKFSGFLRKYRPWRLPLLVFYWDACKAIKALDYANSLAQVLNKPATLKAGFYQNPGVLANNQLRDTAQEAFNELLREDLHWYIANTYIGIVCSVMRSRVTGTLPAPLREASHGLAEVFCITDPTRRDNPIILASPAFTRHSGCPMDYILGRNCRFMQGPGTTVDSCRRFAVSMEEGRDHSEIFVNYRRDGSPFLSMVMNAQLRDNRGNIRYYLGAQVDVSGLLKNCSGLESLTKLVEKQAREKQQNQESPDDHDGDDSAIAMKALSEMLSGSELKIIDQHGGVLQKDYEHDLHQNNTNSKAATLQHHIGSTNARLGQPRVLLADGSSDDDDSGEITTQQPRQRQVPQESIPAEVQPTPEINLSGVYKYYLLVRPAPSLRVLFASPTLRTPGMLQSPFLHRIGSNRMRKDLDSAFQEPKVVTARVRWLRNLSQDGEGEGSTRWIHCTPLIHHTGKVGLWMIVVIMPSDDENVNGADSGTHSANTSIRSGSRLTYNTEGSGRGSRQQDRGRGRQEQRYR